MNVFITGANKGIGLAITKKLLNSGYQVIAVSRSVDNLTSMKNTNLIIYQANLENVNEIDQVLEDLKKKGIVINALFNNVGIGLFKEIRDISLEEWEKVIRINLTIPFYLIHSLVDDIGKEPYGKIINIGSDADHMPFENASVYCATKFGLFGMTESLRIELKKKNIGITTISPARVDTYFNNKKPGCRPISLKADDVAEQVYFVLKQRSTCNIEQIKLSSILE